MLVQLVGMLALSWDWVKARAGLLERVCSFLFRFGTRFIFCLFPRTWLRLRDGGEGTVVKDGSARLFGAVGWLSSSLTIGCFFLFPFWLLAPFLLLFDWGGRDGGGEVL